MESGLETILIGLTTVAISVFSSVYAAGRQTGKQEAIIKNLTDELEKLRNNSGDVQQSKCRKVFLDLELFRLYQKQTETTFKDIKESVAIMCKSMASTEKHIKNIEETNRIGEARREEARQVMFKKWGEIVSDRASQKEIFAMLKERLDKLER